MAGAGCATFSAPAPLNGRGRGFIILVAAMGYDKVESLLFLPLLLPLWKHDMLF